MRLSTRNVILCETDWAIQACRGMGTTSSETDGAFALGQLAMHRSRIGRRKWLRCLR